MEKTNMKPTPVSARELQSLRCFWSDRKRKEQEIKTLRNRTAIVGSLLALQLIFVSVVLFREAWIDNGVAAQSLSKTREFLERASFLP